MVHGSKRWFLYEPDREISFNPDKSTLEWLENYLKKTKIYANFRYLHEYPKLPEEEKPRECLLRPEEAIYFPDKWWHATLNAETSVFISTFLSP